MAGKVGPSDAPLMQRLLEESKRFPFFQAVRLLEAASPDSAPVGGKGPPRSEAIRFRPHAGLEFPTGDVVAIEENERRTGSNGSPRYRLTTSFLGLYGSDSPLPTFFTEAILDRNDESVRREFLDLFHHRLLSLFYRAWLKYRYPLRFRPGGEDELTPLLLGLVGLGTPDIGEHLGVSPVHCLHYAGLVASQAHSACGLECLLSDELGGVPVRVEECSHRWVAIPPEQLTRLGTEQARLGKTAVLASRVYDRAGKYTVVVGPISYALFVALFPGKERLQTCLALMRYYVTDPLAFDLDVILHPEEVPPLRLGGDDPGPHLGWNTWLGRPLGDATVRLVSDGG